MNKEEVERNGYTCNECEFYDPWYGVCVKEKALVDHSSETCEKFELYEEVF